METEKAKRESLVAALFIRWDVICRLTKKVSGENLKMNGDRLIYHNFGCLLCGELQRNEKYSLRFWVVFQSATLVCKCAVLSLKYFYFVYCF